MLAFPVGTYVCKQRGRKEGRDMDDGRWMMEDGR